MFSFLLTRSKKLILGFVCGVFAPYVVFCSDFSYHLLFLYVLILVCCPCLFARVFYYQSRKRNQENEVSKKIYVFYKIFYGSWFLRLFWYTRSSKQTGNVTKSIQKRDRKSEQKTNVLKNLSFRRIDSEIRKLVFINSLKS